MRALFALGLLSAAAPAPAQPMGHAMPDPAAQPGPGAATPAAEPEGTDQAPGSAEPPPIAHDRPADRYWSPADMAVAEDAAMHPSAARYARLTFDLAEVQVREGREGYRWEAEAWLGDLNRLMLKSKGEGTAGQGLDRAEIQALYAMALDPWWNLQVGLRQDIRPRPARSWATLGIEGRAPYQFEVQGAVFLSDRGQITGRLEGAYDQRLAQRLILQPRAEFDLAAQDMPDQRTGRGLSSAEIGLRLRYEIQREFAPYVGVLWTWLAGTTADYARADGKASSERSVVAGVRFWF